MLSRRHRSGSTRRPLRKSVTHRAAVGCIAAAVSAYYPSGALSLAMAAPSAPHRPVVPPAQAAKPKVITDLAPGGPTQLLTPTPPSLTPDPASTADKKTANGASAPATPA